MQKQLANFFLFLLVNGAIVLGHIAAFQSNTPKLSWLTMAIHAFLLLVFPYKKAFFAKAK